MIDFFEIKGTNIVNFECLIYNRWGKLVFSSTDIKLPWDGKINNGLADEGTYFYIIKATFEGGEEVTKQGFVQVKY